MGKKRVDFEKLELLQAQINSLREEFDNKCERCSHIHDPKSGYTLTVHHLDNNKSNCEKWNLAVLCQRCHLHIQGKVIMCQDYMFEHSDWMKPHVDGFIKSLAKKGLVNW